VQSGKELSTAWKAFYPEGESSTLVSKPGVQGSPEIADTNKPEEVLKILRDGHPTPTTERNTFSDIATQISKAGRGKVKLSAEEMTEMHQILSSLGKEGTTFDNDKDKLEISQLIHDLDLLIAKEQKAAAAKAGGFWRTTLKIIKLPFKPISWIKDFFEKLIEKISINSLYHVNKSALSPLVRQEVQEDKAKITRMGKIARKVGMNPKAWTPEMQNQKGISRPLSQSPMGKFLDYFRKSKNPSGDATSASNELTRDAKHVPAASSSLGPEKVNAE
ncbi:hypothetical protein O181_052403, partial [Austropuccinia psidii MF-1]|nr:hypothetical protein [Austropuccinia psidii MF-1]